jgi:hypothetical protein
MQNFREDHRVHKVVWERSTARFLPSWFKLMREGVIAVQTLGQPGYKSVKMIMFEDVSAVSRYKLVRSQ